MGTVGGCNEPVCEGHWAEELCYDFSVLKGRAAAGFSVR